MIDAPASVKVLSLNCWGLKYLAKHQEERLKAIAVRLSKGECDIVALQEVWVDKDWLEIERKCNIAYPYRRRFRAGVIAGPGLCILLKWPIESTFLYRFPINGRPSAFFRGDWYVGKSLAVTIIDSGVPNAPKLAVLNSHMHAPYASDGDAAYLAHRTCQAWDMAKIHKVLRQAGYAIIQVGDLNCEPESLPHRIFKHEAGLADSWEVLHAGTDISRQRIALMNPMDQIAKGGITCDSKLNTWRADRDLSEAKRLDFALFNTDRLTPIGAKVVFTELLQAPFLCSYSDHFGYTAEFAFTNMPNDTTVSRGSVELYDDIIDEVDSYLRRTIPFQKNWRLIHFLCSIVLVVAIQIAITFAADAAAWSSVLLSIVSALLAVTGVVNGLIGLISIQSEKNNIEEVKLEIFDAKRALDCKCD